MLPVSVLGKPTKEDIVATANPRYHDMLNKMESRKAVAWTKLYPDAPPEAVTHSMPSLTPMCGADP